MLTPPHICLAREPVDMRRGIDTLTQYVTDPLHQPWQGEAACVFCNKARSRSKVLRWDKHGGWRCLRRLHQGHHGYRWAYITARSAEREIVFYDCQLGRSGQYARDVLEG
ncbi:IS66 family insertion sequence element accessory protein TnpB [Serratia symbiotica]|uniref:IS66 family insertion sequence element accessory protein TnpB n=1 Tax=Serratia symbiotica TaxID=138074 RepID=UPI00132C6E8D|nr:IS66 family insertion sequence element accessory protein TnpB [Serratia symbiotica]MBF1995029.1 IS66 family insertion sequence element accessory protein TnpB [Serratia symbiotica]QTP15385.1 IS66 family insertion sequence element accessory protein TnpB [Serratia symbiotica]